MKYFGEAKKILCMKIERNRMKETVCLSLKHYLQNVLSKFGINKLISPVTTLLAPYLQATNESLWLESYMLAQLVV